MTLAWLTVYHPRSSHGGKDWMAVGTYTAPPPKLIGNFSATPGVPSTEVLIDHGELYASKVNAVPLCRNRRFPKLILTGFVLDCPGNASKDRDMETV